MQSLTHKQLKLIERCLLEGCDGIEHPQPDHLVAPQAGAAIHRPALGQVEAEVVLGPSDKERSTARQAVQPSEVDVRAIHHVDRSRFGRNRVEQVYVVNCGRAQSYESGNRAPQVEQGVDFDRTFLGPVVRPWKEAGAQLDPIMSLDPPKTCSRNLLSTTLFVCSIAIPGTLIAKPANVLIILSDDQGLHDVSYNGRDEIETPHLDGLAAAGVILNQAYANSSVCSPTRASLLTGRYNNYAGVQGVIRDVAVSTWGYWNPDCPSLVQRFHDRGYHTAMVGKWHLGLRPENHPLRRGFEFYRGFLGDMMDDYYTHLRRGKNFMRDGYAETESDGHATDLFSDWAVEVINAQAQAERPFFLYLAYNAPHNPIQPPEDWVDRVKKREPGISERRARYVAFVEHMDAGIGRVLAALERNGASKNTLVVFASDNGGQLIHGAHNGPYRADKGTMYEGGIRVPTLFSWPGRISPGSRSEQLFMTMDILPTVLGLVGDEPDTSSIEGESFSAQILGEPPRQRARAMIFSRREGRQVFGGRQTFAVRRGGFKLLQSLPFTPLELYNLDDDPYETRDLLADPDILKNDPNLRAAYERLHEEMAAFHLESGRYPYQPPRSNFGELGYE